jgi:hypothetical protein
MKFKSHRQTLPLNSSYCQDLEHTPPPPHPTCMIVLSLDTRWPNFCSQKQNNPTYNMLLTKPYTRVFPGLIERTKFWVQCTGSQPQASNFYSKGPHPLLWTGLQAKSVRNTASGISKGLNCCIIFIIYNLQMDQPHGLVVRVSDYWSWGPGFDSWFCHGDFSLKGKIPMVTMVWVV